MHGESSTVKGFSVALCWLRDLLFDSLLLCAGIELHHVDYQKEYWTQVFEVFTQKFAMGLTPNPDLACNHYIKVCPSVILSLHLLP